MFQPRVRPDGEDDPSEGDPVYFETLVDSRFSIKTDPPCLSQFKRIRIHQSVVQKGAFHSNAYGGDSVYGGYVLVLNHFLPHVLHRCIRPESDRVADALRVLVRSI